MFASTYTHLRRESMANSDRRYIDSNGKQFMPMNVEGGAWNEHFFTTKKIVTMFASVAVLVIWIIYLGDNNIKPTGYILSILCWIVAETFVLRFIVFEEKTFYSMYKVLKAHEITPPSIFWDIVSINDTPEGAIMQYSDAKIGILVKVERDTITGKTAEFKETHYDAISDFYKSLVTAKYKFIQFNVMERAGNDPRLEKLDLLTHKSSNENINKIVEKEIGYIKNRTHTAMYESDYFLIYTNDLSRMDYIIDEAVDSIYILMDGAYIGYRVLTSKEIIEFVKDMYGVKYFNYTQATLDMYNLQGSSSTKPFTILGVEYEEGQLQELDSAGVNKLIRVAGDIQSGAKSIDEIDIRDLLKKKPSKEFDGVDFDNLGNNNIQSDTVKPSKISKPNIAARTKRKPKGVNQKVKTLLSNNSTRYDESTHNQDVSSDNIRDTVDSLEDNDFIEF